LCVQNYFVSSSGLDTNDGSESKPFKTLEKALEKGNTDTKKEAP